MTIVSQTVPSFAKVRLLVAGDVMLDRYWTGPTSRISPEAPVQVVQIRKDETRPGGAANVALNAAALGVNVHLLGVVGNDEPANLLRFGLHGKGIEADFVQTRDRPTITKLRIMSRNQQLIRLDFEESLSVEGAFDREAYLTRFKLALVDCDAVILSDYGKGTLCDVEALIAAARAQGKPVLIDPKGSNYHPYHGATLLTPNMSEFEAVVGPCQNDDEIISKGEKLRADLAVTALLITRSERGMTLLHEGHPPLHLPTQAREVFDVTGAGDTVVATLGAAIAAKQEFAQACRLANIAAGIVVGKIGTATVSTDELHQALHTHTPSNSDVVDEEELLRLVTLAKKRGASVVMTNGCFDLLHVGHVKYLDAARELGDILIVAVNSDESVKRLKGESRPLNTCADRMSMLAALKSVNLVVPFSEDTPARIIGRILPDLLVKGGDYKPEQIAGYKEVTANGGQVAALEFHSGYSTTHLIERARNK